MRPTLRHFIYSPARAQQPAWVQAARLAGQHRAVAALIREGKVKNPHGGTADDYERSAATLCTLAIRARVSATEAGQGQ